MTTADSPLTTPSITEPSIATPASPLQSSSSAIATHDLNMHYGSFEAVKDLNINIPHGGIYGFLGENGAGKTTTIRMLTGIIKPTSGSIEMRGKRFSKVSLADKKSIGYVAQEQHFYPWMTCRDLGKFVSRLYPNWNQQQFSELLDRLNLAPKRKSSDLSGGMKTKLALALAIASQPELLILDEPTTGLDLISRREVMQLIIDQKEMRQGSTLFSTHLIEEVEQCATDIGVIHRGKLLFEGKLDPIVEQMQVFKASKQWLEDHSSTLPVISSEATASGQMKIIAMLDDHQWQSISHEVEPLNERGHLESILIACIER